MTNIRSLTLDQLTELAVELDWKSYSARQLYGWLWQKGATSFDQMTNIAKDKRTLLAERFTVHEPVPRKTARSRDGTLKVSLQLVDDTVVEAVYIPDADRRTVCVSTQAGCALGCVYCRTGRAGAGRNLDWEEIAGQVLAIQRLVPDRLTNVVFMGMGEPLLNYKRSMNAIRAINSDLGINIGARRITLSTAGVPDAIRRYARFELQSKLAVSLNASDDKTRSLLMPVNRRFPLDELIASVREFTKIRGKRVTFEYVLVRGLNDQPIDASRLTRLLNRIPCKLNLIPLNPLPGLEYQPPTFAETEAFARRLYPDLPAVTVRKSKGQDILAACGQLAAESTGR